MSKCQCQSSLHNHDEGACPNEANEDSGLCDSCKEKDIQLHLDGIVEFPGQLNPTEPNSEEPLIVVPPEKPEQ